MLTPADRNRIAVNIWTARVIPIVLAGIVGYATYVLVALCCVNYLLVKHDDKGAAIPILVIYFLLFILMTACFLRLVHVTLVEPPYVPLGATALRDRQQHTDRGTTKSKVVGIAMGEYNSGINSGGTSPEIPDPFNDPDSPGLELFYTKDVFVCSTDGRPIWCSECSNWKPDRAHHDSSSGRCIRKMDHFCPWVGGPVGENNLKFFIQFNGYTALYCFHLLVVMAYYIHMQVITEGEDVQRQFIAILALATFFGLFTASMAGTSLNLAALNLTQVERLGGKTKVYILAILKAAYDNKPSPLAPLGEITYPLEVGFKPENYASHGVPIPRGVLIDQVQQDVDSAQSAKSSTGPTDHNSPQRLPAGTRAQVSQQSPTPHIDGPQDTVLLATVSAPRSTSIQANGAATEPIPIPETPTQVPTLPQNAAPSADGGTQQCSTLSRGNWRPRESLVVRDLRATRTFTVLKMSQPGDNPWDLGSARLNLETVMGANIYDWLLPFRRSPCCNHEDGESQFQVGPKVAFLRASMAPSNPDSPLNEPNGVSMNNLNHDAPRSRHDGFL